MSGSVHCSGTVDRAEWLEIARHAPGATFFHTPYWHELAARCGTDNFNAGLAFTLPGARRAVVPLVKVPHRLRGLLKRSLSTFGTCYGGTICKEPLTVHEELAIQHELMQRTPALTLVANPFAGPSSWHSKFVVSPMSTQVLTLEPDFGALLKNFSKGHRAAYTKARREGVKVRRAHSPEDVSAYYVLYLKALEKWGKSARTRYSKALFSAIVQLGQDSPDLAALWIAEREGLMLAGAVVFYWNGHADYWHGAMHDEHHSSGAVNFLLGELIRDTCERGFKWFDFNPSGGHDNVVAFKRRFGAQEMHFDRADHIHRALRVFDSVTGASLRTLRQGYRAVVEKHGAFIGRCRLR